MKVRESFFFLQLELIGIQPLSPHRLWCFLQSTPGSTTKKPITVCVRALKDATGRYSSVTGPANDHSNICDVYFQHRWFTKLLWWGFITPSRSEGSRGTSEYIWWRERAEVKPEEDGGHTNQPYTKSHRNPPPPPPQASLSLPSSSLGLLLRQQRSSAQEIDGNASRKRIIGVSGLCVLVSLSLIGCTCFLAAHDHAWKHNNLTLGLDHCFLLASYLDFFFFLWVLATHIYP